MANFKKIVEAITFSEKTCLLKNPRLVPLEISDSVINMKPAVERKEEKMKLFSDICSLPEKR